MSLADEPLESYTILTTDASSQVQFIHDRMPAILKEEDVAKWLNPQTTAVEAAKLLRPYEGELLYHRVSEAVNKVGNHSFECMDPVKEEKKPKGITAFFAPKASPSKPQPSVKHEVKQEQPLEATSVQLITAEQFVDMGFSVSATQKVLDKLKAQQPGFTVQDVLNMLLEGNDEKDNEQPTSPKKHVSSQPHTSPAKRVKIQHDVIEL